MTGPKISRPCFRSVDPVSTTSATASATPSRTADSTAPSRRTTVAVDALAREEVAARGRRSWSRRARPRGRAASRKRPIGPGEPEGRGAEVERVDLDRRRVRVEQQVAAGDADVERAGADVGGDVARAQVEELDVVARVGDDQLLRVAAGRRTRPRAASRRRSRTACPCWARRFSAWLVPFGRERMDGCANQRCRQTSAGVRPFASIAPAGGRAAARSPRRSRRRTGTRPPSRPRRPLRRSSCRSRARRRRARATVPEPSGRVGGLLAELREQRVEGLHAAQGTGRRDDGDRVALLDARAGRSRRPGCGRRGGARRPRGRRRSSGGQIELAASADLHARDAVLPALDEPASGNWIDAPRSQLASNCSPVSKSTPT